MGDNSNVFCSSCSTPTFIRIFRGLGCKFLPIALKLLIRGSLPTGFHNNIFREALQQVFFIRNNINLC